MDICFHFFLIKLVAVACLGHIVVFKKPPNCYPKWLSYSTYLPIACENSSCFPSSPMLNTIGIFNFSHSGIMVSHFVFNYFLSHRACTRAKIFMCLLGGGKYSLFIVLRQFKIKAITHNPAFWQLFFQF